MVKNLPAMQETQVRSLDREDPLENGMATHFSILVWRIPMDKIAWPATFFDELMGLSAVNLLPENHPCSELSTPQKKIKSLIERMQFILHVKSLLPPEH